MNRSARIIKLETRTGIGRRPRVSDLSDAERHNRILSVAASLGGVATVRALLAANLPHLLRTFDGCVGRTD